MNLRTLLLPLVAGCTYTASLGSSQQTQNNPSVDDAPSGPDAAFAVISPWPAATTLASVGGLGLVHARGALYWMDTATSQIMTMPDDASTPPTPFAAGPTNLDNVYPSWLVGDDTGLAYLVDDPTAATRSLVNHPFDGARTVVATRGQAGAQAFTRLAIAGDDIVTGAVTDLTAFPRGGGTPITVAYAGATGNSTACPLGAIATSGTEVFVEWAGGDPRFGCPVGGMPAGTSIAHVPVAGGTPTVIANSPGYTLGTVVGTTVFGNSSNTNSGNLGSLGIDGTGGYSATATIWNASFVGFAVADGVLYWSAVTDVQPVLSEVGCLSLATGASRASITGAGHVRSLAAHGNGVDFRAECPKLDAAGACPLDELHHFSCVF